VTVGPSPETRALALAKELIRCPSVTPRDEGALDALARALEGLGFACHRLTFSQAGTPDVSNLYARFGAGSPNFCFAGHSDVVPVGTREAWTVDPFGAEVIGGRLYGRGATDMKGAIAAFVAAAERFLSSRGKEFGGAISLLVTGDEEGPALNGTVKVLEWLKQRGERLDACLVGEPTSAVRLGDAVKIGRRGSLNARLTVRGVQGHTAYPHLADNPIPKLLRMLSALTEKPLDHGSDHFEPSNLEITTIDVGNTATNVIPAVAQARFNVRFNDLHTGASLERLLAATIEEVHAETGGEYDLSIEISGEPFLCPPGRLADVISSAIEATVGIRPEFNTMGGTSDARFIQHHCEVAEFGLPGRTMHKVDECVEIADLDALTRIYEEVLRRFFTPS
jgi:succinyl-diaminopimelate desuccinylase